MEKENKKCAQKGWMKKEHSQAFFEGSKRYWSDEKNVMVEAEKKKGENNPLWRGDNVKYSGLHAWVRTRFPKTDYCEICSLKPPRDLANKGIYDRNLENWEWLCRKCHMTKDGRISKMAEIGKKGADIRWG